MSTSPHSDIRIAPLATLEDFGRCVVLQLETWGYSDGDVVPRRIFMVAQRIGGQVIGAFDGDTIVGFAIYALAAMFYIIAIKRLPLSIAFPSVSLSYIVVAILAHILWDEPLGLSQLAGIALIAGGILLLHRA